MAANKKWINLKHLDLSRNLIGYKESLVLWGEMPIGKSSRR